jgi:hypothetical protein
MEYALKLIHMSEVREEFMPEIEEVALHKPTHNSENIFKFIRTR